MNNKMILPTDSAERKRIPLTTGVLDYFPRALAEVAKCSFAGNEQHHPGKPLHWDKSKSTDHADCIVRHLIDRHTRDTDGIWNSAKAAWRALALLETQLEAEEQGSVTTTSKPDADGWIAHDPITGGIPVDQYARVAVKLRDGSVGAVRYAGGFHWDTEPSTDYQIIAYKVIDASPAATDSNDWIKHYPENGMPVGGFTKVQVKYADGSTSYPSSASAFYWGNNPDVIAGDAIVGHYRILDSE